jgi:hypothetical protein
MQIKKLNTILPFLLLLAVFLNGCGSSSKEGVTQTDTFRASAGCIECHATSLVSGVTGAFIVSEWENGAHNTKNGAGCPDCHATNGHPTSGAIPTIPSGLICVNCHNSATNMKTFAAHFSNFSASYLGLTSITRSFANPVLTNNFDSVNNFTLTSSRICLGCHNPHDNTTLLSINKDWATSAHAATTDDAFKEQIFIKSTTCNRCHTGSGFRYYMTTGNQTAIAKATLGTYSSAREVIGCSACHTNYSFKRISTDTSVTFANFSTPYARTAGVSKNFPANVGDTKLCIPCHSGRSGRSGATIANGGTNNDPHYFPAAGIMYVKYAFNAFTSAKASVGGTTTSYGQSLTSSDDTTVNTSGTAVAGSITSTHRKLGTTAINGDSHNPSFFVPGNLDSGGPCVVCHMKAGHTLKITPDSYNKVCINCHTSERGTPLNANNFLSAFVDENRDQMNNALALAVKLLEINYDITVQLADIESAQEASLVKKSTGGTADFTHDINGTLLSAATQIKLRGAAWNVLLGYKDNSSFVHARTLMRRLIYDSIDFLDNGAMDLSVGATALNPLIGGTILDSSGNPVFQKNPTNAFADSTLTALAPPTTPSMTYILGFSRTTGLWATPERP